MMEAGRKREGDDEPDVEEVGRHEPMHPERDRQAGHQRDRSSREHQPAPGVSAPRWNGPAQLIDHQHRWNTERWLLHDEALKPEDRLAGLLVLLYAQGATAISQMTTETIQAADDGVRLRLGRVPVHLPEPVAALASAVLANRKGLEG